MNTRPTVPTGELRVSNAEREPVIEQLKQAYAEGRLDHGEFDLRVHLAMTAKTRADLATVTRDLATPTPPSLDAGLAVDPTPRDRLLAAIAHGSGYFTTFVGPLVFMLTSGRRSSFIRRHAVEALNFQLTLLAVVVVTFGFGAILYAITWIVAAIGALAALAGQRFDYPFTLRLIH
ncbi:MAG TPA: DUF1707 and DUF4870 domain-containing protein [Streptosporangiaceae bacterium]|nr:DUF1707 and DUF4870 domain-containing protein [Streptosporangiaceae bacterium]